MLMAEVQAIPLHSGAATLTLRQVARLFEVPEHRLRYWSQTGFVRPSGRTNGTSTYTFRDLIAVKVACELLAAGLSLQRVRRSLDALRTSLPDGDDALSRLRIRCDHDRIVAEDLDGAFEATTGQLLLDFRVDNLTREVAAVLTLPWVSPPANGGKTAYEWFLQGCDAEDTDPEQARICYEAALELDPDLSAAWTNLGSLRVELEDLEGARDAFSEALRCDPDQPEAQVNLAELALRDGEPELAISGYRHVLRQHPDYVEAHYGLARALLRVGGRGQALAHLERFCRAMEGPPGEDVDAGLAERLTAAQQTIARLRRELGKA